MNNITEFTKLCSLCEQAKPINRFVAYRDNAGQVHYGLVCDSCWQPEADSAVQAMVGEQVDAIHSQKIQGYEVQESLATNHRSFGEVAPPEVPPDKQTPSAEKDLYAGDDMGLEHGAGDGQKKHPLLSEAAQFQDVPPTQTPNATDSEAYNKQQDKLRLEKQQRNELTHSHTSTPRPSPPGR